MKWRRDYFLVSILIAFLNSAQTAALFAAARGATNTDQLRALGLFMWLQDVILSLEIGRSEIKKSKGRIDA